MTCKITAPRIEKEFWFADTDEITVRKVVAQFVSEQLWFVRFVGTLTLGTHLFEDKEQAKMAVSEVVIRRYARAQLDIAKLKNM